MQISNQILQHSLCKLDYILLTTEIYMYLQAGSIVTMVILKHNIYKFDNERSIHIYGGQHQIFSEH